MYTKRRFLCAFFEVADLPSPQLREKLTRRQVLMRSSVPDGDLAAIIDEAVTAV